MPSKTKCATQEFLLQVEKLEKQVVPEVWEEFCQRLEPIECPAVSNSVRERDPNKEVGRRRKEAESIVAERQVVRGKLVEEFNKLKPQGKRKGKVNKEVWAEISDCIKRLTTPGYVITGRGAPEPDYPELVRNIRQEAEEKVANRKRYAAYGKMDAKELERAWYSSPNLRIEFDNYFQRFVSCIMKTFPDSPSQFLPEYLYLRDLSDEHLKGQIEAYRDAGTNAEQKDTMSKSAREIVSLEDFMQRHCQPYKGIDLKSRKQALYRANKSGIIKLPKSARPFAIGKSNVYYADELTAKWGEFSQQVNLPPLQSA